MPRIIAFLVCHPTKMRMVSILAGHVLLVILFGVILLLGSRDYEITNCEENTPIYIQVLILKLHVQILDHRQK